MHRAKLLSLLDRYERCSWITSEERPVAERIRAFVKRCPDCFHRGLLEGHITGSAWLLNHERDACLLTHHKKLGLWLQPGGHADGQSDVLEVALREAREESGITGIEVLSAEIFDVDVHAIPETPKEPAHYHYDVRFLLRAPPGARFEVSEESHGLAWVPRHAVRDYNSDASVWRLAEKWMIPL